MTEIFYLVTGMEVQWTPQNLRRLWYWLHRTFELLCDDENVICPNNVGGTMSLHTCQHIHYHFKLLQEECKKKTYFVSCHISYKTN